MTLSRFSESPSSSCWYLRVTLTPERPSYNSCIVHLLHPAHQIKHIPKLISLNLALSKAYK